MTTLEVNGLDRTKNVNNYNYTEDELLERKIALKLMKDLYPLSNEYYNEMIYDLCKNTPADEMEKIKKKIDDTPFKYSKDNAIEKE